MTKIASLTYTLPKKASEFRKKMFCRRSDIEETPIFCKTCSVAYWDDSLKLYRIDDELKLKTMNWILHKL